MSEIVLIAHNLRSTYNVGSLLRTADGIGTNMVYLTGYTPYPLADNDLRLPYLAQKINRQIIKTALGAENTVPWQYVDSIEKLIPRLKNEGFVISALEQSQKSISLPKYNSAEKQVLIVGREVEGIEANVLNVCDSILEIPMLGRKESFNVVQAAAMALYHMRYGNHIMLQ